MILLHIVCALLFALSGEASQDSTVLPMTVKDDLGFELTFSAYPSRIVSLAPSNTEILYAVGAGDRVVGVTTYCDYPPEVRDKEQIGGFTDPNVEKIVSLKPDLVLAVRGNPRIMLETLRKLNLPVFAVEPESLEGVLEATSKVGKLVGRSEVADSLVSAMQSRIRAVAAVVDTVPLERRPRVLWGGWTTPIYTAGPGSLIDDLIRAAGGVNIAADAESTWPQYDLETVVVRDPQVILSGYMEEKESLERAKEELKKWDGWRNISAVRTGRIYAIGTDLIGRPGPRVIEGLERMASVLYPELSFR